MKRLLTLALALLLVSACIAPAFALPEPTYNDDMSFSFALGVNGDSGAVTVAPGDVLTLTVSAARVDADEAFTMYALLSETVYDSACFELVPGSAQMTEVPAHKSVSVPPVTLNEKTTMKFGYDTKDSVGGPMDPSFTVGTFKLRVKPPTQGTVSASTTVYLQNCYLCTADGMERYVTTTQGSVAVTIGDPAPPADTYRINITQPGVGGTITSSPSGAQKAGEKVTLSVALTGGYTVNSWYVIGAADLAVTGGGRTQASFTMPARDVAVSVSLSAPSTGGTPQESTPSGGTQTGPSTPPTIDILDPEIPLSGINFSDVPQGHWAFQYVEYLSARGFVNGKTDTEFMPDDLITRAEFITILARMSGDTLPSSYAGPFTDIETGSFYERAVAWGVAGDIVKGTSDTEFSPNRKISRQEISAMLSRYASYMEYQLPRQIDALDFTDADKMADYAKASVSDMQRAGIVNGYEDGTFRPAANATRAEAAKMIGVLHYLMSAE